MIKPQECVRTILRNNPELAKDVFDLLLWVDQPNLPENSDYKDILDDCWIKTQACRDARHAYAEKRLRPFPAEIALASSASS